MRPFATSPRKLLPAALGGLLLTLLLAALWRPGDASTAMDRLFQSVIQPTATTGARLPATVAPTATTRGGRAAPTATPAARVLNAAYIRRLPLVLKGWPPTPTPTATPTRTPTPTRTATPTATPTPTPIKYGWKGVGYPGNLYIAATPIVDKIGGKYRLVVRLGSLNNRQYSTRRSQLRCDSGRVGKWSPRSGLRSHDLLHIRSRRS